MSVLLNLIPESTSADFKQIFTFLPLCNPTPSSSMESLIVFCEDEYFYMDIQKDLKTWKIIYVTKSYSLILLIRSKTFC